MLCHSTSVTEAAWLSHSARGKASLSWTATAKSSHIDRNNLRSWKQLRNDHIVTFKTSNRIELKARVVLPIASTIPKPRRTSDWGQSITTSQQTWQRSPRRRRGCFRQRGKQEHRFQRTTGSKLGWLATSSAFFCLANTKGT